MCLPVTIGALPPRRESLSGLPGVRPGGQVSVIGRSRRQRVLFGDDYVTEEFEVDGKAYKYRQMEEAFSQPNAYTCRHMLHWARSCTAGSRGSSLLELYCGNANLSIPVAEVRGTASIDWPRLLQQHLWLT